MYRLVFIATKFQAFKAGVHYEPDGREPSEADINRVQDHYNFIITVEGTTEFEFEVPYARPIPVAQVLTHPSLANAATLDQNFTPRIRITLINDMQTQTTESSPVTLHVYQWCHSDFEWMGVELNSQAQTWVKRIPTASALAGESMFGTSSGPVPVAEFVGGERITGWKHLVNRKSVNNQVTRPPGIVSPPFIEICPQIYQKRCDQADDVFTGPLHIFQQLFAASRGGMPQVHFISSKDATFQPVANIYYGITMGERISPTAAQWPVNLRGLLDNFGFGYPWTLVPTVANNNVQQVSSAWYSNFLCYPHNGNDTPLTDGSGDPFAAIRNDTAGGWLRPPFLHIGLPNDVTSEALDTLQCLWSPGDDFQLLVSQPPPKTWVTQAASMDYNAYYTYNAPFLYPPTGQLQYKSTLDVSWTYSHGVGSNLLDRALTSRDTEEEPLQVTEASPQQGQSNDDQANESQYTENDSLEVLEQPQKLENAFSRLSKFVKTKANVKPQLSRAAPTPGQSWNVSNGRVNPSPGIRFSLRDLQRASSDVSLEDVGIAGKLEK